jgi:hypothetical protein
MTTARPIDRSFHRALPLATALLLTFGLAGGARPAAAHDGSTLKIEVHGDEDKSVTVDVGGWLGDLVRAAMPATVHCAGDRDDKVVAVLSFLDRHGEGSSYTLWDDGREIRGSRAGGRFELRVSGRPGWRHGRAHIEAPWGLARCMIGGTVAIGELIDGDGTGLDVLVTGDDGRVHVSLH